MQRARRRLRSWGTDRPCVAYLYQDSRGVREAAMVPFWVHDASGRAHVVGPHLTLDLPMTRTAGAAPALMGSAMLARHDADDGWFEEAIIGVGDHVTLTGPGVVEPDGAGDGPGPGGPFRSSPTRVRFASLFGELVVTLPA